MYNSEKLFAEYKNFISRNHDAVPAITLIPESEKQNRFQYVGGQIINNCLFGIINSAEKMLKYNISNNNTEFLGRFTNADFKWSGGCVFNDILYFFPRFEKYMLTYNPKRDVFGKISCNFEYDDEHHYGGCCTPSGIVYQPPRDSNHILKWNLKTGTCDKIYINNKNVCRYCGNIIHPNGYIYFIPEADFPVIKMDIKSEEITYIGDAVSGLAFDTVIAYNGNIYGFRCDNGILKIAVHFPNTNL